MERRAQDAPDWRVAERRLRDEWAESRSDPPLTFGMWLAKEIVGLRNANEGDGMCWARQAEESAAEWEAAARGHADEVERLNRQLKGAVDALREARRSLEAAASWLVDTERHERMLAARRRVDDALERFRGR